MDTSLEGITALVTAQGVAFEEFKKANDAKIVEIETKGHASADALGKVDAINADLNRISEEMKSVAKQQARNDLTAGKMSFDGKRELTADEVEHKTALMHFIRTGKDDGLKGLQLKAMNSLVDPEGGYLIDKEMDAAIDRFAGVVSALPRLARSVTVGAPVWQKLVKTSGMAMRRVAEGATGGETTEPKYARIEIAAFPAEVEPWVYNETLEDSFVNLEADLAFETGIAFAEGSAAEYITGDGVGKARGILGYTNVANASFAWGNVGYIPSGKSAAFASVAPSDAFINLQHGLKSQYRGGAVWLMNDTTLGVARQMKDASGQYYLWQPDVLAGFGGRFLGSPVEIDDNMPAIGANTYSVAYGDFQRGYAIVNRAGTSLIRDNITAKGTTKFNFRRRFGAGITNFEAIKLMKFATS